MGGEVGCCAAVVFEEDSVVAAVRRGQARDLGAATETGGQVLYGKSDDASDDQHQQRDGQQRR